MTRKLYLTAELRRRLEANRAAYQEAERLTGVPWALLAAIHYRENTLSSTSPNASGPMQKVPPWTAAQTAAYAMQLQTRIAHPPLSLRDSVVMAAQFIQNEKARPRLTAGSSRAALLDAAYRYNGTGYGDINLSPYVYGDPLNGKTLILREGSLVQPDRAKGGVNVLLDEILGAAPATSVGGEPIPAPSAAPAAVYYPIAGWARVRLADGGFLSPAYRALRHAWHPAQDMNVGPTAQADLGEPVYSIADGVVTHAGYHAVAGNIVVIHHPQLGVWSAYWHVRDMFVTQGQTVSGAAKIATIGIGDPAQGFSPHLHFEIRVADLPPGKWPGDGDAAYAFIERNYRNPVVWLRAHGARDIPVGSGTGAGVDSDLHPELVRVRGELIAWLRVNRPDLRLVTTRTYDPPLRPGLGPAAAPVPNLGPHSVKPALAFDYVLRVGAAGALVGFLDPLYATLGQLAEKKGATWGPNASPAPANEGGNLRNHIQLRNTEQALRDAQARAAAGTIPSGSVDTDAAGAGSDPEAATQNRRQNCPTPQ